MIDKLNSWLIIFIFLACVSELSAANPDLDFYIPLGVTLFLFAVVRVLGGVEIRWGTGIESGEGELSEDRET